MKKFLLIGSVAAVLCGDCVWGMKSGVLISEYTSAQAASSDQFKAESARENASPTARSRRNSRQFNAEPTRENARVSYQDTQAQTEQAQANSQQSEENRFIKIEFEGDRGYNGALTGAILNNTYQQYHYDLSNNSKMGRATPTTVVTVTGDNLRGWNDIAEIRYANDVSYDKLENPKVILYRNRDNSCYIILRIEENKHGVFYGTNERNIEVGRSSFAVYDVSEDVGSFTDSVARLIYVDESGLYFVPKAENSVKKVIDSYQKEGKFKFEGSVIKVSAVDGTITLNGKPVTKDNFFDNWIQEGNKTVLSTKQPDEKEILRNFYPPEGKYEGMYSRISGLDKQQLNTFTEIPEKNSSGYQLNLTDRKWMDYFIRAHILIEKSKSKEGCEEVVRNGMFSSFLSKFPSRFQSVRGFFISDFVSAINRQIRAKGISDTVIPANTVFFSALLRDPEFVRGLKKQFADIEAKWRGVKTNESEMWIPFEIVKNL